MSDLRSLLEEDGTSIEADILRQARAREPAPGAAGRALAVLGIAGAATTAAAGAAAAPALLVAKWVGVGALSAVVLIGGGQLATVATERSPVATSVARIEPAKQAATGSRPEVVAPVAAPAVEEIAPPSPTNETAVPAAPPIVVAKPAMRAPPVARGGEPSTLAVLDAEIALLDAARDAVAAHDANRALRLLDDHDVRFPSGQLAQEATYVRVKALLERGSRADAELTARRLLEAHPSSPHAKRIRALLGQ